jgi:hypothetical protein
MASVTTFDIVGAKEDVSDVISNISPTKTPFTSMTGSEKCSAVTFEWQEDSLRSVAENAQVQGFTATPTARTPTVMRDNRTQIMQDTFEVAGTTDAISTYGRGTETALQASKAMAAIKRDLEHAFVGTGQTKVAPANNLTASKMAGVQAQIDSTMYTYTGGAGTAMTETNLLDALEDCYAQGAEPSVIMVTPKRARAVAAFAAASGRNRDIQNGTKDRAIINVVDLYVSPYGEQKVVLNRFLKAETDGTGADTLVFDPANWNKVTLRPWSRETLAKTGDRTSHMLLGEFSLKHKNFKASAIIREAVAV